MQQRPASPAAGVHPSPSPAHHPARLLSKTHLERWRPFASSAAGRASSPASPSPPLSCRSSSSSSLAAGSGAAPPAAAACCSAEGDGCSLLRCSGLQQSTWPRKKHCSRMVCKALVQEGNKRKGSRGRGEKECTDSGNNCSLSEACWCSCTSVACHTGFACAQFPCKQLGPRKTLFPAPMACMQRTELEAPC